jgi:hypothetical protein
VEPPADGLSDDCDRAMAERDVTAGVGRTPRPALADPPPAAQLAASSPLAELVRSPGSVVALG